LWFKNIPPAAHRCAFAQETNRSQSMPDQFQPKPEHKFSFGLWTVGNRGRDPFGDFVREPISPVQIVEMLAEVGAWGVNLHDNDLVPIDATPQ
jgi:xylose isomerase